MEVRLTGKLGKAAANETAELLSSGLIQYGTEELVLQEFEKRVKEKHALSSEFMLLLLYSCVDYDLCFSLGLLLYQRHLSDEGC